MSIVEIEARLEAKCEALAAMDEGGQLMKNPFYFVEGSTSQL